MDIVIAHYIAQGQAEERLQFHIHGSVNLGSFTVSDSHGHSFNFNDSDALTGDKIILFTGTGTPYSIAPEEGDDLMETIHIYYWDTDTADWEVGTTTLSISDGTDIDTYTLDELLYVPPLPD